ncbi:MAG: hypothetical protein GIX03_13455 [Candidatus Eremiobacteraeota bacterium]|nr:hypothetical protein [Candidatus Eremiobacteraeota bacterium]MBC5803972.1 hypothetical protein [Candidatus Eremiobacteraeota bacterium]MBC5823116.1 hypothetical protein [Candidatus Eremiobacteraeota bacterium]
MDFNTMTVAVFGTFAVFGFPIAAFIILRLLAHRERMEMIRHGLSPQAKAGFGKGYQIPSATPATFANATNSNPSTLLRKGITLTFIGLALTIGLSFIGLDGDTGRWHPGPWLLGGLIPLFIGLAQVTTAFLTDPDLFALLGRRGFATRPPGPTFTDVTPPPGAPDVPHYDTSYTYRPGDTQELRPPTAPPERRP